MIQRISNKLKVRAVFISRSTPRKTCPISIEEWSSTGQELCLWNALWMWKKVRWRKPLCIRITEHKMNVRDGETEYLRIGEPLRPEPRIMQWDRAKIIHEKERPRAGSLRGPVSMPLSKPRVDINPIWVSILKKELKTLVWYIHF